MIYIEQLQQIVSHEQVTTNEVLRTQHGKDESYHEPHLPDVVVYPKTAQEVSEILTLANEQRIPVVPFGLGTSLEGHVIPYQGGISLDLSLMNAVLEVRPEDFLVKVQPGVTRSQLNKELKNTAYSFLSIRVPTRH